jgi:hypothetical protein
MNERDYIMERISITNSLLEYMFKTNTRSIVGGYSDYKTIQSKIVHFNQNHKLNLKIKQKKMLLVDPSTAAETERVWLIEIVGASNNPDFIEKKQGRPKKSL